MTLERKDIALGMELLVGLDAPKRAKVYAEPFVRGDRWLVPIMYPRGQVADVPLRFLNKLPKRPSARRGREDSVDIHEVLKELAKTAGDPQLVQTLEDRLRKAGMV